MPITAQTLNDYQRTCQTCDTPVIIVQNLGSLNVSINSTSLNSKWLHIIASYNTHKFTVERVQIIVCFCYANRMSIFIAIQIHIL